METAAKNIIEKFSSLLDSCNLSYGLVTLLTIGGELIFSNAVFQCPCHPDWNETCGMVFLLVPALALLFLGYVLNTSTWRLTTGCCNRDFTEWCTNGCQGWKEFVWITFSALVAPLTWLGVALLGGTFYVCSASGQASVARRFCLDNKVNCSMLIPKLLCMQKLEQDQQDILKALKAQSQVYGWYLIGAVCIILMIGTSITYCGSPVNFMQLKFSRKYVTEEQKSFIEESRETATKFANKNVNFFFEHARQKHKTPSAEYWKEISKLSINPKEEYYSVLHKYVETEIKSTTGAETGEANSNKTAEKA